MPQSRTCSTRYDGVFMSSSLVRPVDTCEMRGFYQFSPLPLPSSPSGPKVTWKQTRSSAQLMVGRDETSRIGSGVTPPACTDDAGRRPGVQRRRPPAPMAQRSAGPVHSPPGSDEAWAHCRGGRIHGGSIGDGSRRGCPGGPGIRTGWTRSRVRRQGFCQGDRGAVRISPIPTARTTRRNSSPQDPSRSRNRYRGSGPSPG